MLLSRSTAGIVADDPFDEIGLRHLGSHGLKGLVAAEEIFQLVIEDLPADFRIAYARGGPATETATVLMADVGGKLTTLSRTIQADEFHALIAQYHQRAHEQSPAPARGLGVLAVGDTSVAVFRSPRVAGGEQPPTSSERLLTATWPGGTGCASTSLSTRVKFWRRRVATSDAVNRCFSLCAHCGRRTDTRVEVTRACSATLTKVTSASPTSLNVKSEAPGSASCRSWRVRERLKHVGHVALEILENRERHPVDDGRAVQHGRARDRRRRGNACSARP